MIKILFLVMALINIVPQPKTIKTNKGSFSLKDEQSLICYNNSCINSANYLNDYLLKYYGFKLDVVNAVSLGPKEIKKLKKQPYLELMISSDDNMSGSYELSMTPKCVSITGTDAPGVFYAIQSFIQLLPATDNPHHKLSLPDDSGRVKRVVKETVLRDLGSRCANVNELSVPLVNISDSPRFGYRGMHLDVVRHMFPVEYIKRYIDYIAMHKINYLHWHLTDDQGWRLESKVRPQLNEKGAYRDATIIGAFPGTGVDSTRYGGFYTQAEAREIIDYAAKRYITIVPEIDIPGHCMGILSAFPCFGTDPKRKVKPAITWGIFNRQNNVLAPSEDLFEFLEDVFNELMDIFPGKYIHIGADECAHKWWKESEIVQDFIRSHNLVDENGLQKYFAQRVSNVVKRRGRIPIGWDEMLDNGLVDGTVVMSWRNPQGAWKAAAQGHGAILTPSAFSYFNVKQTVNEPSVCHRSKTVSLYRVYNFDPLPDSLFTKEGLKVVVRRKVDDKMTNVDEFVSIPNENRSLILGGQGCLWTEYMSNIPKLEYFLFPRLSAISEVYWSSPDVRSWNGFLEKLPYLYKRYKMWGVNYCPYKAEEQ